MCFERYHGPPPRNSRDHGLATADVHSGLIAEFICHELRVLGRRMLWCL